MARWSLCLELALALSAEHLPAVRSEYEEAMEVILVLFSGNGAKTLHDGKVVLGDYELFPLLAI